MAWNYYQDMGEEEPVKPQVKPKPKDDYSALIMLGLGLLGGYLLFSKEDEEKKDSKPLDNLDKAVANKIEIHGNPNILVGGRGDSLSPKDVDPFEYAKDLKVEKEHTTDKKIASEIALDHLAEDDKYYTHLEKIHRENPIKKKIEMRMFDVDSPYGKFQVIISERELGEWKKYGITEKDIRSDAYTLVQAELGGKIARITSEIGKKITSIPEGYSESKKMVGAYIKRIDIKENPIKDPKGGLTAEGRRYFKETEGANLKPGVMKVETLEDLKRWGQWARRFFGRSILPPLKNEKGEPTRLALDAQAWGCKIPKTIKEAKVIAKRGTEALRYYKELKKQGLKKNDSVRFKICHD